MEIESLTILTTIVVLTLIVAEIFCLLFWIRPYYKIGFVVLTKKISFKFNPAAVKFSNILSQGLAENMWHKRLLFRGIAPNEIIFREKLYKLFTHSSFPLIRGYLQIFPEKSSITITGRLNLIMPLIMVSIILLLIKSSSLAAIIFGTGLFLLYFLWILFNQIRRYNQIAEMISILNENIP